MVLQHCDGLDKSVVYVALAAADEQKFGNISVSNLGEETVLTIHAVRIYRLVLNIENGVSSTEPVELALVRVPDGTVDDIKFVDDEALMLSISKRCWWPRESTPYEICS